MFKNGQQIAHYTLIRRLGKGGFGEVWLAESRSRFITTKVALKLQIAEHIDYESIKLEAMIWSQASGHPNIISILDAYEYDGKIIIASEYAPDGSLADRFRTLGRFSIKESIEIIIGVLTGLEYLHSKKIIHRDIKPANILLHGNIPKLTDFGISRSAQTSDFSSVIIGTDAYMSPESFRGYRTVQTDIWSVGVVLYQLLKGSLPFPQTHPSERMFSILMEDFAPLSPNIPAELLRIIKKSLEKITDNRYQTAFSMREDLKSFFSSFTLNQKIISSRLEPVNQFEEIETVISLKTNKSYDSVKEEVKKILSVLLHIIEKRKIEEEKNRKNEIVKIIFLISRIIFEKQRKYELRRNIEISRLLSIISQAIVNKMNEPLIFDIVKKENL